MTNPVCGSLTLCHRSVDRIGQSPERWRIEALESCKQLEGES